MVCTEGRLLSLSFTGPKAGGLLQSTLVRSDTGQSGVRPAFAFLPNQIDQLHSGCSPVLRRFAGPMERLQAEAELINRVNSTYLVRHRSREYTEYAISIK